MTRRPALTLLLLLAVATTACGDDAPSTFRPPDVGVAQDGPEHIHGLGVNPADRSLLIATHSGLFRAAANSDTARRVGDRRQDTMGFTIVGPDRFLGSGHPDLRDDLPPLLGLIRSDDAGRSWEPVSLLGEADFHVLRTAGTRIYGVNSADGELLVSDDGGRNWRCAPRGRRWWMSQRRPTTPTTWWPRVRSACASPATPVRAGDHGARVAPVCSRGCAGTRSTWSTVAAVSTAQPTGASRGGRSARPAANRPPLLRAALSSTSRCTPTR